MIRKLILVLIFTLFAAVPVSAEYYKYYDESGNLRFTDDINQIPLDQREQIKTYTSIEPEDTAPPPVSPSPTTTQENETTATASERPAGQDIDYDQRIKELDAEKLKLANEYKALMEENARLAALKKTVKTPEAVKDYNAGVKVLNERLKEHDRKRKAFFSAVEEYNAMVDSQNKRKKIK